MTVDTMPVGARVRVLHSSYSAVPEGAIGEVIADPRYPRAYIFSVVVRFPDIAGFLEGSGWAFAPRELEAVDG